MIKSIEFKSLTRIKEDLRNAEEKRIDELYEMMAAQVQERIYDAVRGGEKFVAVHVHPTTGGAPNVLRREFMETQSLILHRMAADLEKAGYSIEKPMQTNPLLSFRIDLV